jgi:3-deoxy-manno-octulosonate cytidylyltransferase (CMP-KDO synthetase)
MERVLGVIPARYASTRFPGKPLAPLGDKSILEEVWQRAASSQRIDRLVVATDDPRIVSACEGFGAEVLMTDAGHPSGTDRVAEVAERLGDEHGVVLNIQGDEPLLTGTSLDELAGAFDAGASVEMATLVEPLETADDLFDPNVVKVVAAASGRALYFSRAPIPYHRGAAVRLGADFREALAARSGGLAGYRRHQGIYGYRRETLLTLSKMPPSSLESDEGLEQLRALEAGISIQVVDSDFRSQGVDTPADLERVARILTEAH